MKYSSNYKTISSAVAHINSDLTSYKIQPDMDYLLSILNIRRYSYSETQNEFVDSLEKFYLEKGGITNRDTYGNLYVVKGEADLYPCIVAHTDINQTKRDDVSVIMTKDFIFGFDNKEALQCGIGADDGAGIALAYEMFNRFDAIKLFFPKDEEVGLKGTYASDATFFTDCSMILQGDRRSYTTDLITYTNGIETCSKEFVDASLEIMNSYGYSENRGVCTDIGGIKGNSIVNCIACNVSIGYFNEHSDEEVMSIKAYYNAVNFVYELISKLGHKKWYHVHRPKQYDLFENTTKQNEKTSVYKSWSGSSDFDPFSDDNYNYNGDFSHSNDKISKSTIDLYYNDYVLEVYSEYKDPANREKLISLDANFECINDLISQEEIDESLHEEMCPVCLDDINVDNELYLNVQCYSCNSWFNVTNDNTFDSFNTDLNDNSKDSLF